MLLVCKYAQMLGEKIQQPHRGAGRFLRNDKYQKNKPSRKSGTAHQLSGLISGM